jgi:hypothetical protein
LVSFSVQPVKNVFRSKIVLDVLPELADFWTEAAEKKPAGIMSN